MVIRKTAAYRFDRLNERLGHTAVREKNELLRIEEGQHTGEQSDIIFFDRFKILPNSGIFRNKTGSAEKPFGALRVIHTGRIERRTEFLFPEAAELIADIVRVEKCK